MIEAFLGRHAERAMFPLSNLSRHGMAGGHQYAVQFWYAMRDNQITDVLTLADGGMVLPYLPSGDYAAAVAAIGDRPVTGFAGPQADVRGIEALGYAYCPRSFDQNEPHFLLYLNNLVIPEGLARLRPMARASADVIKGWIADYDTNTLNAPLERAAIEAERTYDYYMTTGSHKVLMDGDTALCMTGFNAEMPDIVQLGGVYTPPELRGRGFARRAVALHLEETAARGVTRATLFSASEMAARAYRSVGFECIGEWSLILFDGPQERRST
jgi:GNAT superfamily N-acetyltransferase